jgi:acetyl esterase/lipase
MLAAELYKTDYTGQLNVLSPKLLRPDFVAPIYPVVTLSDSRYVHKRSRRGLLGEWRQFNHRMQDSLSLEKHVPDDCPPVFLCNCINDPIVKYQNSVLLDSALTAHHIPHKYIQYRTGGHGFGADTYLGTDESRQWMSEFIKWLKDINIRK